MQIWSPKHCFLSQDDVHNLTLCSDFLSCDAVVGLFNEFRMWLCLCILCVDFLLLYPTGFEVEVFGMTRGDWLLKWRAVRLFNRKVAFM
jgi:hypothetical protein